MQASTHLKKLNMDVAIPQGKFYGVVDLGTGDLAGFLILPPARVEIGALGPLRLVEADIQMTPAWVTGKVDFATLQVTSTSVLEIRITRMTAAGLPANLVGNRCQTATPITVSMAGPVDLVNGSTFTGTYTIPPFETCGLLTPAINTVISGPGNTFTGTFTPPT